MLEILLISLNVSLKTTHDNDGGPGSKHPPYMQHKQCIQTGRLSLGCKEQAVYL